MDRAFVSFAGIRSDEEFDEQLKHLFLWFDEVIFEDIGGNDRKRFLDRHINFGSLKFLDRNLLSDSFIPVREAVKLDWDERFRSSLLRGYPRWGEETTEYHYPNPQSPSEMAHNALLKRIEGEHGVVSFEDGYAIEQAEGRARVAVDAVSLWREVANQLPCVLNATPDEEVAIKVFRESHVDTGPLPPGEVLSGSLPNLSLLDWSTILQIKRSDGLAALKKKAKEAIAVSGENLQRARREFEDAERDVYEDIIDRSRPRPGRALIEGVLGNIPMGLLNPFSIAFSWRGFSQQVAAEENYAWVYMLRDIRSAIRRAEGMTQ